MEEELYIAMDRYLANDMNAEEKLAFEIQLNTNSDVAEKFAIYQSATDTLTAGVRREENEKLFRENLVTIASTELVLEDSSHKINWYTLAAAASVALLCVAFFYTSLSKPDFEDYAHYEPLALVTRGGDDALKQQAQQAFNSKKYSEAVTDINALLKEDSSNIELLLYKGIALLELNKTEEAKRAFKNVQASASVYSDKATWMLALSALKEKDYKTCETLLKQIPEGSAEYVDAQKLLGDL